jgi:hypothetical protein
VEKERETHREEIWHEEIKNHQGKLEINDGGG